MVSAQCIVVLKALLTTASMFLSSLGSSVSSFEKVPVLFPSYLITQKKMYVFSTLAFSYLYLSDFTENIPENLILLYTFFFLKASLKKPLTHFLFSLFELCYSWIYS
jgi:hypothetical protein